jgi:hypothetical protein
VNRTLRAGALYFALVFVAGFILGTLRERLIAPWVGSVGAVLIETPIMLAVSFWAARFVVGRLAVPARAGDRLLMGGAAFLLLMLAETVIGVALMGQTVAEHVAGYARPRQLIGLLAQIAFALFPLIVGPPRPALSDAR